MQIMFADSLLIPEIELENRIGKFQSLLKNNDLDGALIVQSADVVYFCGTYQNIHLYIPVEGTPIIMVRKNFDRITSDSKLKANIVPLRKMGDILTIIKQHDLPSPERLGLEMDVLPVSNFQRYQGIFKTSEFIDCSLLIRQLRAVKTHFEILRIKETSMMMDNIFNSLPSILRTGISEFDLVGEIENVARREGHQGWIRIRGFNAEFYFGQLLSGTNSAVTSFFDGPINGVGMYPEFPFGSGSKIVERDEPILFDYVGAKSGYMADMTRTYVIGKITNNKYLKSYEAAFEIQQSIIQKAKPGILSREIYELSLDIAKKYGLQDNFMGAPPVSFVGHGIGLELNELPVLAKGVGAPLEKGMVFAVEPKFTFPHEAGIGLENTFVMNETGVEKLSNYPDHEIIKI